jgi:hypothetical protein
MTSAAPAGVVILRCVKVTTVTLVQTGCDWVQEGHGGTWHGVMGLCCLCLHSLNIMGSTDQPPCAAASIPLYYFMPVAAGGSSSGHTFTMHPHLHTTCTAHHHLYACHPTWLHDCYSGRSAPLLESVYGSWSSAPVVVAIVCNGSATSLLLRARLLGTGAMLTDDGTHTSMAG